MKRFLMFLLIVIAAFVLFVASRPSQFRIERSVSVGAPAATVYAQIVDFHRWPAWSPWEHLDPSMSKNFSGAPAGVGSVYDWSGNDKVGTGRMTITAANSAQKVVIKLEFLKPFQATNTATFSLSPEASGTRVNWAMEGRNNFIAKCMGVFMNMDKMVGGDFERGLASLKQASEGAAPAAVDTSAHR